MSKLPQQGYGSESIPRDSKTSSLSRAYAEGYNNSNTSDAQMMLKPQEASLDAVEEKIIEESPNRRYAKVGTGFYQCFTSVCFE